MGIKIQLRIRQWVLANYDAELSENLGRRERQVACAVLASHSGKSKNTVTLGRVIL